MANGSHGIELRGAATAPRIGGNRGFFGRMFEGLDPFSPTDAKLRRLADGMKDTAAFQPQGDNPNLPAGFTYFGQFVDHDLTLDRSPLSEQEQDPEAIENFRTPRFDLDSLYGRGPRFDGRMYTPGSGRTKLKEGRNTGAGLEREDLPRDGDGLALIGDERNDENVIVSQLHLTFIRFHNRVVDRVRRKQGLQDRALFREAYRIVRWHYQWVVVHDFLRRVVGKPMVDDILRPNATVPVKLDFFSPGAKAFMPVEFSAAAYRFGHSAVRGRYVINQTVPELPIFSGKKNPGQLEAFHGERPMPRFWTVSWPFFFELDRFESQLSRKIDHKLAPGLFTLTGQDPGQRSLALRNLRRGRQLGLPSGEDVAEAMGEQKLTRAQLGASPPTPLWFYLLREAAVKGDPPGQRLGPVGGRIVAETFLGLMLADEQSYVSQRPTWTPEDDALGQRPVTDMARLIRFAAPKQARRF
jgi:hypothetical protein